MFTSREEGMTVMVRRTWWSSGRETEGKIRDASDITSFYFTCFPKDTQEKDLSLVFKKWGNVREVFIATGTAAVESMVLSDSKVYPMSSNLRDSRII